MAKYHCKLCKKQFSTHSGLTQHANAVHHGRKTVSKPSQRAQQSQSSPQIQRPEHDANLWSMSIMKPPSQETPQFNEETTLSMDVEETNLPVDVEETNLSEEVIEDISDDSGELLLIDTEDNSFDFEDLQGATLDDALKTIEGKNTPEYLAQWPNETYQDFMELVIEGNVSNIIGDKIIKFFNKHSNLKASPLPRSTKIGKDYLNQIKSPSIQFKEKVVKTYSNVDFILHYRPIFRAIQTLLQ
jgi:hypothetical protein